MAAEILKLDFTFINVAELVLFWDAYLGYEFFRHLYDSILATPFLLCENWRSVFASFRPVLCHSLGAHE